MMKKSIGFTLGEILIALSVIGVVASLVLPNLINGHKAGTAKAQFDTAYAMVAKAIVEMEVDNVSVEPASYTAAGSFYDKFKKYQRVTIDCGKYAATNDSVCISTTNTTTQQGAYKRLDGGAFSSGKELHMLDDGCFVVNNGMLMCIENPANYLYGLMVMVDINGKNKNPNKLGYDLFAFELIKGGILLPLGAPGTGQQQTAKTLWGKDTAAVDSYCNKNAAKTWNGMTCAYKAATDEEYFKKLYQGH